MLRFTGGISSLSLAAKNKVIRPKRVEPSASWSHGILVDDTLYISGMGGEGASGKIPDGFDAELQQALGNIGTVLKAAGMSPAASDFSGTHGNQTKEGT